MAGPGAVVGALDQLGRDGREVEPGDERALGVVVQDELAREAPLEDRAAPAVEAIEALGVAAAQLAHGVGEVAVDRAHEQVFAIRQKCVAVDLEPEAAGDRAQLVQE